MRQEGEGPKAPSHGRHRRSWFASRCRGRRRHRREGGGSRRPRHPLAQAGPRRASGRAAGRSAWPFERCGVRTSFPSRHPSIREAPRPDRGIPGRQHAVGHDHDLDGLQRFEPCGCPHDLAEPLPQVGTRSESRTRSRSARSIATAETPLHRLRIAASRRVRREGSRDGTIGAIQRGRADHRQSGQTRQSLTAIHLNADFSLRARSIGCLPK